MLDVESCARVSTAVQASAWRERVYAGSLQHASSCSLLQALAIASALVCPSVTICLYMMGDRVGYPSPLPHLHECVCVHVCLLRYVFGRCSEEDLEQRKVFAGPGYWYHGMAIARSQKC